ncbi:MAG: ABC transporter ATP-binding protein [Gemmatimonadales bacterium]|nr:MAG: ABC transporter ATP-binding protein [Gemmatimonadales bacterium]
MTPPPILEGRRLHVTFHSRSGMGRASGPVKALRGVDVRIEPGELVGIVGESGSGKSTLLRALTHLAPVDSGEVLLDGVSTWGWDRDRMRAVFRPSIRMLFQDSGSTLNPGRRVGSILAQAAALAPDGRAGEPGTLLEAVGLSAAFLHRWPRQLSGGEKRRVAMARALATRPRVLLADEPFAGLDVVIQQRVVDELMEIHERLGLAMLVVSHDLSVIRGLAERIMVMKDGVVVESMKAEDFVVERLTHPYSRTLVEAELPLR